MKKLFFLCVAGLILLTLTCGTSEFDITINVTNPQDLAVKYGGYYKLEATGDSIPMEGYTPGEYTFTMAKGDMVEGLVFKDTIDVIDTLNLQILADDDEKVNENVILPTPVGIQFQLTVE